MLRGADSPSESELERQGGAQKRSTPTKGLPSRGGAGLTPEERALIKAALNVDGATGVVAESDGLSKTSMALATAVTAPEATSTRSAGQLAHRSSKVGSDAN